MKTLIFAVVPMLAAAAIPSRRFCPKVAGLCFLSDEWRMC